MYSIFMLFRIAQDKNWSVSGYNTRRFMQICGFFSFCFKKVLVHSLLGRIYINGLFRVETRQKEQFISENIYRLEGYIRYLLGFFRLSISRRLREPENQFLTHF